MNVGLTQAFMAVAQLDGGDADSDPRDGFIQTPTSEVAKATLAAQYEQLQMARGMMTEEDYTQTKAQLDQIQSEALGKGGETTVTIERPSDMESLTTIETTGEQPSVEILYASLGGKIYLDVTDQGDGFSAEATTLPLGSQAFTETLSGGWELAK